MNATELFHKDGRSAHVWYCGQCRNVKGTQEHAEQCCGKWHCKECGAECANYHLQCQICFRKQQDAKERERFAKAEKVTEWDGWVFCDGLNHNNGYFSGMDDLYDQVEPEDLPDYVWTCTANRFVHFDMTHELERIAENGYEDCDFDDFDGLPELKKAVDAFNEANAGKLSYEPDFTKAVLVNKSHDLDDAKLLAPST